MTLDQFTDAIRQKTGTDSGLNAKVKFLIDGEQVVHVDATQVPNVVSNEDLESDCLVRLSAETLESVLGGKTNATMAFMMGKIKVDGNLGVAMNITKIL